MGLSNVQDGAASAPAYQITAGVFDRVTIHLNPDYFPGREFTIVAQHDSPTNIYIQRAVLNGTLLGAAGWTTPSLPTAANWSGAWPDTEPGLERCAVDSRFFSRRRRTANLRRITFAHKPDAQAKENARQFLRLPSRLVCAGIR